MNSSWRRGPPVESPARPVRQPWRGMTDSYARGDTSRRDARRDDRRQPGPGGGAFGDRDALVSCAQGRRYTYAELGAAVDELARALMAAGWPRATGSGSGAPTAPSGRWSSTPRPSSGAILVNINPAYRTSELEYALRQSGCRMLIAAPAFKTSDYRAMIDEVATALPELERVVFLDWPDWDELLAGAGEVVGRRVCARAPTACAPTIRSTSSTRAGPPAFPRARRSPTTTSSTTATSSGRGAATPRRTGSASRCPSITASAW